MKVLPLYTYAYIFIQFLSCKWGGRRRTQLFQKERKKKCIVVLVIDILECLPSIKSNITINNNNNDSNTHNINISIFLQLYCWGKDQWNFFLLFIRCAFVMQCMYLIRVGSFIYLCISFSSLCKILMDKACNEKPLVVSISIVAFFFFLFFFTLFCYY